VLDGCAICDNTLEGLGVEEEWEHHQRWKKVAVDSLPDNALKINESYY
jgi:hypothetical protein